GYHHGVLLYTLQSSGNLQLYLDGPSTSITGSSNIADNAWHYIVGTYDGSQMRIFSDGASAATPVSFTTWNGQTNNTTYLGNASNLSSDAQTLDEVRISNIARS